MRMIKLGFIYTFTFPVDNKSEIETPEFKAAVYMACALAVETLSGAVKRRANVGLKVAGLFSTFG